MLGKSLALCMALSGTRLVAADMDMSTKLVDFWTHNDRRQNQDLESGSVGGTLNTAVTEPPVRMCGGNDSIASFGADDPLRTFEHFRWHVIKSATPNACFNRSSEDISPVRPDGTCPIGTEPQTDQAYLWGMAVTDSGDVFYGTGPSVPCLVELTANGGGQVVTELTNCEFSSIRPPEMWRISVQENCTAPHNCVTTKVPIRLDTQLNPAQQLLRAKTLGIRSAGTKDGVVIFGGPAVPASFQGGTPLIGVNLFAFSTEGVLLGAKNMPQWTDIRRFTFGNPNEAMYVGVGQRNAAGGIYKWVGSTISPFQFVIVGKVGVTNDIAAEVSFTSNGRLIVTTWPTGFLTAPSEGYSQIYLSGSISAFTPGIAQVFPAVFSIDQYDPDPKTAKSVVFGQVVEFQGWFYFGTLQLPFTGLQAHNISTSGPASTINLLEAILATWRPTTLFRGRNFGTSQIEIEVLYGECALPVLDCDSAAPLCLTSFQPTGVVTNPGLFHGGGPKFGHSGFGSFWNVYTWSSAKLFKPEADCKDGEDLLNGTADLPAREALLFGTFDTSLTLEDLFSSLLGFDLTVLTDALTFFGFFQRPQPGADLYVMTNPDIAPTFVTLRGLDNSKNYGFRNMLPAPKNGKMWIGTANPFNLSPMGGYELYHFDWINTDQYCCPAMPTSKQSKAKDSNPKQSNAKDSSQPIGKQVDKGKTKQQANTKNTKESSALFQQKSAPTESSESSGGSLAPSGLLTSVVLFFAVLAVHLTSAARDENDV
eukprot:gb/GEZN01001735.1/.p1 GENE.gb/GEZN01001735.1/~~gb/GEZN01001735.1/.p1  ORF type:complete len:761 (-),score=88.56 gb/GEZN01001735.1/:507-2789(-)